MGLRTLTESDCFSHWGFSSSTISFSSLKSISSEDLELNLDLIHVRTKKVEIFLTLMVLLYFFKRPSNSGFNSRWDFLPSHFPEPFLVIYPLSFITDLFLILEPFNLWTIVDFSKSEIQERTLRIRTLVGESSNQLSGFSLEMRV